MRRFSGAFAFVAGAALIIGGTGDDRLEIFKANHDRFVEERRAAGKKEQ